MFGEIFKLQLSVVLIHLILSFFAVRRNLVCLRGCFSSSRFVKVSMKQRNFQKRNYNFSYHIVRKTVDC